MRALTELWAEIRGLRVTPPRPKDILFAVPEEDDPELVVAEIDDTPDWKPATVSGLSCIISYIDAKGATSLRQIECRRLERKDGVDYLSAFCLQRGAHRSFRCDRIEQVIDNRTGELLGPGTSFFSRYASDETSRSGWRFGLSPVAFTDLNAGLNVLTFIGRCDGHWHPLERERIEDFVSAYWLRAEMPGDYDRDAVLAHTDRLAPDSETFVVSVHRCRENPVLSNIIRRHAAAVIAADGKLHNNELFWGGKIDEIFARK